ncbi:CocE/NonD family hydrolase [Falsihalocynthiibacter sp. SS001]|uniref:CocE/NonD family hydrolase n=1 Tax=Falsihalocynthiibacter sp. SS001 TaxID=3349698 RepID=UPI0036D27740
MPSKGLGASGNKCKDTELRGGQNTCCGDKNGKLADLRNNALCCTGDPNSRAGPLYQNEIENRADVLTFTSEAFNTPLHIAVPLNAQLSVSLDRPDTDLIVRLADVAPDGRSLMIQEGALRPRYRKGFESPELMQEGEVYSVNIPIHDIADTLPAGHKLRLHIAGSSFPRLARNINSGGDRNTETEPYTAEITIHSGPNNPSAISFYTLPAAID